MEGNRFLEAARDSVSVWLLRPQSKQPNMLQVSPGCRCEVEILGPVLCENDASDGCTLETQSTSSTRFLSVKASLKLRLAQRFVLCLDLLVHECLRIFGMIRPSSHGWGSDR